MCYDFYDYNQGFKDGKAGLLSPMQCPYDRKPEIIAWTQGFCEGVKYRGTHLETSKSTDKQDTTAGQ